MLIAEDNEDLARYVAGLLKPYGRVRWARDGEVALSLARECKPALIVSDVMMPNRDGMWLCRQIGELFPEEPPPVILLTALSERKALLAGWDAGAADFLHKPFHPLELTTRVRTLLQAREARLASLRERRKLEERLFESQKLDSLGLMAGGIAHDFNNLLAVITGQLELAEYSCALPEEAQSCLHEAMMAANRAAGLARQMLTYVGKVVHKKGQVDLSQMARETAQMLERGLLPKPIFHMDLAAAMVEADRSQIGQVLLNLITNAAEAAPEGVKPVIQVQTGTRYFSPEFLEEDAGGTYAYLRVEDNGCGMDEELRKRIFDPFFSTKFTGRGLGLAAVHGILRAHSAKCKIVSQVGSGTTFWVLFQASGKEAELYPDSAVLPWRGQGTILVVDDEPQVRKMVSRMLTVCGFEVFQADSAKAALSFVADGKPLRAALIDVILPDLDGHELAGRLQSLRPHLPCLLCSGFQGHAERSSSFPMLPKPFTMQNLRDALRGLLERPRDPNDRP